MPPMFTELFVETDAEDLPAEENRGRLPYRQSPYRTPGMLGSHLIAGLGPAGAVLALPPVSRRLRRLMEAGSLVWPAKDLAFWLTARYGSFRAAGLSKRGRRNNSGDQPYPS